MTLHVLLRMRKVEAEALDADAAVGNSLGQSRLASHYLTNSAVKSPAQTYLAND